MNSVVFRVLFLSCSLSVHAFAGLNSRTKSSLGRRAAAPYTPQFPYGGAQIDGLPGSGLGGILVPAAGDTAHEYQDPPAGAFRGPCPGMNVAANHGFLSRDGVTTFDELVAAQQNMFNFGYDLSVFLATVGVAEDGDVVTEKLSIGGDATSQTSSLGPIQGPIVAPEGGLNTHNTFESDTSLTRNDFFLANGDNHSFNGTLFSMMSSVGNPTGMYDVTGMGNYRAQRWDQSQAENPNFFFGPKGLLLYAAASFLYEVYPSANGSTAQATVESFFGAVLTPGSPGGYASVGERVPPNWFSRKAPYGLSEISEQAVEMYNVAPRLFGGNTAPNSFDALGSFANGTITGGNLASLNSSDMVCLLYQLVVADDVPDSLNGTLKLPAASLSWALGKLNPIFGPLGCPLTTL